MLDLKSRNVTLIGIDGNHPEQLLSAATICQDSCHFADVKLLVPSSLSDPRTLAVGKISSHEAYNFFAMKRLAEFVATDFALVIQYDGYIQNPAAWDDAFLEYDYIGAPWFYRDACNVGNGGFSLRSRKLLQLLKEDPFFQETMPEDFQICRRYRAYLESKGIRFAPEALAAKFSLEGNYKFGFTWKGQFGFHDFKSTLGVKTYFPTREENIEMLLRKEIHSFREKNPEVMVQFQIASIPLQNGNAILVANHFRDFLKRYLLDVFLRVQLPAPVILEIYLEEADEFISLRVLQQTHFPNGLLLRPQYAAPLKATDDPRLLMHFFIPKQPAALQQPQNSTV